MTNEELDALDRQAAEKVMRWHLIVQLGMSVYVTQDGQPSWVASLWRPTSNVAQAWDVLEMRGSLFRFGRHLSSRPGFDFQLTCTYPEIKYKLSYMTPGGEVGGPEADTAPLAIVLAALQAVEHINA